MEAENLSRVRRANRISILHKYPNHVGSCGCDLSDLLHKTGEELSLNLVGNGDRGFITTKDSDMAKCKKQGHNWNLYKQHWVSYVLPWRTS